MWKWVIGFVIPEVAALIKALEQLVLVHRALRVIQLDVSVELHLVIEELSAVPASVVLALALPFGLLLDYGWPLDTGGAIQ